MILVFLLFALFASVFTFGKTALLYSEPLFLVGTRMFTAGLFLVAYEVWKSPERLRFERRDWFNLIALALFNIYLTNALEFWGLQYLSSFKTCFIYTLSPFASALVSYLIFRESMTEKKWLGLLIGCLGFLPILFAQSSEEESAGSLLFLSLPEVAIIIACLSSVYGWILLKKLLKNDKYSPQSVNGTSMLIGGAITLLHSRMTESWTPLPIIEPSPTLFECWVALIIISNFICYNLYGYLLKNHSATFLSFAGFSTPMFTALFGWLFLKEAITPEFYLSGAIVFIGLFLFYQEELKSSAAII